MQKVILNTEARKGLLKGITLLSDAVVSSLGPNGRNTIYEKYGEIYSTKDGVTIAKEIKEVEDPLANMGLNLIKQASIKTADKVGDGTTTSTLLANQIINSAFSQINSSTNIVKLNKEIKDASLKVLDWIENNLKQDIIVEDQLKQIATISANNDEEIGELVFQSLMEVGMDGIVHIEESKTGHTYLESVEGIQFPRGYKSPYFVTDNNKMSAVLENPYILLLDGSITQVKTIVPLLERISGEGRSLLIVCDDIDGEALAALIVNKMRGTLKVCAVKSPDFGDMRRLIMEDIAVLTGGKLVSSSKGMNLAKPSMDWLGEAKAVTVTKGDTTIVDGKGSSEDIEERAVQLREQLALAKTPFEKEKLNERLSKIYGGVSIIHVGGNTETEMRERKDRIDDSLHATKAAYQEGIIPGGGIALLRAADELDANENYGTFILKRVLRKPFYQILRNAGMELDEIMEKIELITSSKDKNDLWLGYDAKDHEICNMLDKGIIDPYKVTKNALINSVSIAGTIMLTDTVIVEEKEDSKESGVDPSMFM